MSPGTNCSLFFCIIVDAFAGFTAKTPGPDQFNQKESRSVLVAQLLEHALDNPQQCLQSDHVRQGQGPNGMIAPQDHTFVDIIGTGYALTQRIKCFIDHGAKDPVDGKSRRFIHNDRILSKLSFPMLWQFPKSPPMSRIP